MQCLVRVCARQETPAPVDAERVFHVLSQPLQVLLVGPVEDGFDLHLLVRHDLPCRIAH